MASEYTEDSVQSLSPLEHIRVRPGMYIGRLGDGSHIDDGIYILLKEIIDNVDNNSAILNYLLACVFQLRHILHLCC